MHFRFLTIFIFSIGMLTKLSAQSTGDSLRMEPAMGLYGDEIITLMFVGDISPSKEIIDNCALPSGGYDFKSLFKYVQPILGTSDLVCGNLNTSILTDNLSDGDRYAAPPSFANDLAMAGFNFLFTSNNQCLDYGRDGLVKTIKTLDSLGIRHSGTYINCKDRNSRSPSMFYRNGFNIALLNYTYGTNQPGASWDCNVNLMIKDWIVPDIRAAKAKSADFTVVYLNWGFEGDRYPSLDQSELAKELMDAGADLVVGTHAGVTQKVDWVRYVGGDENKYGLLAYSLGNFLTGTDKKYQDGGVILEVKLCRDTLTNKVQICRYDYIPTWMHKQTALVGSEYFVLPVNNVETGKIGINPDKAAKERMNLFANYTRGLLLPTIPEARYNLNEDVVADVAEMIHIINKPVNRLHSQMDTNIVSIRKKYVYSLSEGLILKTDVALIRRKFTDVKMYKDELKELFGEEVAVIAEVVPTDTATEKSKTQYKYITVSNSGKKSLAEIKAELKASDLNEIEINKYDSLMRSRGVFDTTYRVQFYALRSLVEVSTSKYPSVKGFEVVKDKNGYYYYLVGAGNTRTSLDVLKTKLISEGLKDAFVVQYVNRKRVNYFPLK